MPEDPQPPADRVPEHSDERLGTGYCLMVGVSVAVVILAVVVIVIARALTSH